MISDEILEAYFSRHPLGDTLNRFSAAEKSAALNAADLDVAAELGRPVTDGDGELLRAALAEQTIHLLIHRETLTDASGGTLVSESIDGVGSRVYRVSGNAASTLGARARALLAGAIPPVAPLKRG